MVLTTVLDKKYALPMTSLTRPLPALLIGSAVAVALAGCASPAPADDAEGLSVVASTNVYGDIAQSLAGDLATVTSIIDSAAIDPHSYEASAQDQLAIANADIVIENGGGYDPFVDVLVEGSGSSAIVVSAVEASGLLDDDHAEEAHGEDDHAEEAHADEVDRPVEDPFRDVVEEGDELGDGLVHGLICCPSMAAGEAVRKQAHGN